MKILVVNAGSSSLKYQLFQMDTKEVIAKGIVEKIGAQAEFIFTDKKGEKVKKSIPAKNHDEALEEVMKNLVDPQYGFIKSLDEINAIGHRVVHGGDKFASSHLITDEVIKAIDHFADLAPLHNPPNLKGILACMKVLPNVPEVAVFDTAFHQTMPESSFIYAIPYEYYEKYKVRRYGFHGTSHNYVSQTAAEFLGKKVEECNFISCHLGNGASLCAIKEGKSVHTTMGMTPLDGVAMGTRCGSIDPSIILYIMEKENLTSKQINDILNKKSGLLGVSGLSNDMREIRTAAAEGNKRAKIAFDVMLKRIRHYMGAYFIELGRLDAIIFTAGIGENEGLFREKVTEGLENYGVILDKVKNAPMRGELCDLSMPESRTKILLVPTNEELMIALDTEKIVKNR